MTVLPASVEPATIRSPCRSWVSQRAMFARAVENGVYTATVNRVGEETLGDCTLLFQGGSIVYSIGAGLYAGSIGVSLPVQSVPWSRWI